MAQEPVHSMKHRHITDTSFSLVVIDDILDRGRKRDWIELRDAVLNFPVIAQRTLVICEYHIARPEPGYIPQKYILWRNFIKKRGLCEVSLDAKNAM